MKVIKRNRSEVDFDSNKILVAITKANAEIDSVDKLSTNEINTVVYSISKQINKSTRAVTVEEIQDIVEDNLMRIRAYKVARAYIRYRYDREKARNRNTTDDAIMTLIEYENEEVKQENSNKNPMIVSTQRDYMAGEVSKDITNRYLLPKEIVEAHKAGIIHFHDADYFAQHMHNCCLVNLGDMLQNGTVISGTMIDKPHKFSTACNIATQIIAQVASSQYGGQSISLAHLAPFVDESRKSFRLKYPDLTEAEIEALTIDDVVDGVQTIQYQVVTLMTTNGQAPFITVYMDINEVEEGQTRNDLAIIIREVLRQRIEGVKNEKGIYITPAFPKLIYCLDENNAKPGTEYFYLTKLAAKCSAKRMVPDYISAKIMRELKEDVYTCMGCRSFLTPDRTTENVANAKNWVRGKKYYGRFNQGVVTINLVDVALTTKELIKAGPNKDEWTQQSIENLFFKILADRLELCYKALMCRHKRLEGTPSDVAPIQWQYGALARLEKGETIDKLLHGGYSTISLGYAGLYECTKAITGESHTGGGKEFALKVMRALNDACNEWKAKEDVDFSLYGTPLESTTYKFAKCLQKRFGIIEGITDHNYITNSYHVCVREPIDAFSKLKFESEFQALSPGGAISYVEVPNMQNNIPAVLTLIEFIYDNIMYAEINTKSDYCQVCGYDGEIKIVEEDHKLIWECPNCGNRDQNKMNVARRTCGYIGTNFWNQGRTQEIKERVLHL